MIEAIDVETQQHAKQTKQVEMAARSTNHAGTANLRKLPEKVASSVAAARRWLVSAHRAVSGGGFGGGGDGEISGVC